MPRLRTFPSCGTFLNTCRIASRPLLSHDHAMAHEAFVQCRVSVETKSLLRTVAVQKGLPESVVLRQLIETVLGVTSPTPVVAARSGGQARTAFSHVRVGPGPAALATAVDWSVGRAECSQLLERSGYRRSRTRRCVYTSARVLKGCRAAAQARWSLIGVDRTSWRERHRMRYFPRVERTVPFRSSDSSPPRTWF